MEEEELKALKYCLQFSKKAYEQETERQRHAMGKADYLLKYLTLLMTAFNITISVVSKMSSVHIVGVVFWGLYMPMLLSGILGIISTLMIQKPRKIMRFPSGKEELLKVQRNPSEYDTECKRIYQEILRVDKICDRLKENNDKAMKWIMTGYICMVVMIVAFGTFITYVMCLS
ncbi:MAG: hypothetical protein K2L82_03075 [Lachnospiraceae bacterium]|nr:hypothetical protein [Lachnospiraceae bacterium]